MKSYRRIQAIAVLAHHRWATKNERTRARIQLLTRADDLGFAVAHLHEIDGNPITDAAGWQQVTHYVDVEWPRTQQAAAGARPILLLAGDPQPAPPQVLLRCDLYNLDLQPRGPLPDQRV